MITLEEAKTHLRVDGSDEDIYISGLISAAQEYIEKMITPLPVDDETPAVVPNVNETQKQCVRMIVAHWYEHRESVVEGSLVEVPMAVEMLLTINRPAEGFF